MTARRTESAAALLAVLAAPVAAQTVLDDTASPRQQVAASFEWVEERPRPGVAAARLFLLQAQVNGVEYRLDTQAHQGQRVRIFLEFPRATAGLDHGRGALLGWRARGPFADGAVEQGGRSLVFEGVLDGPELRVDLDFTVTLDARDLTGPLQLAPLFVLEPR